MVKEVEEEGVNQVKEKQLQQKNRRPRVNQEERVKGVEKENPMKELRRRKMEQKTRLKKFQLLTSRTATALKGYREERQEL